MSKILAQGMITLTQLYEGAQVILTPAAVLIPCDSKETPKSNAYTNAFTNVKAFLGTMDITSKITLGTLEYSDSTVRASKSGTKVSITAITTRTGYVDIPVSVAIDGETINLGKHRFSFVKQIDGQTGQPGQPGIPGDPGFSYTLNIKGGTRGIAYAANGTNPEPNTSSQFSVELLKNGVKVSNPASISWTCGGNLSGSSSAATFTPTIKSTYASGSSYVKVSIKEFAGSLAVEETIPIICTKHADGLDWINEWNGKYVQVGTEKIITPKIFAGTKSSSNELTGVAIGRDVLGGNTNKVIGIVGYKKNTPVFSLDQDANFFVSSSGSAGDIKNGTNNAKGLYFDGSNLYISGKVKISGGSTIGENNTSVEDVINNSNLGAQANNKLDNLSIGGRNYWQHSSGDMLKDNTTLNEHWYTTRGKMKISSQTIKNGIYLYMPYNTQNDNSFCALKDTNKRMITIAKDTEVSLSCDLVVGSNCNGYQIDVYNADDNEKSMKRIVEGTSTPKNRKLEVTFRMPFDNANFYIYNKGVKSTTNTTDSNLIFNNIMLTIGNKVLDWTPAPEDIDNNITDVKNSLSGFQNTVNTTFKDGIIEQAEAKAIARHIQILDTEKADIDKEYSTIYNNSALSGTAKTNLASAKTEFDNAHTSLKSTINTAIADGKVSSSEKTSVDRTFSTYNSILGVYKQRVQEALDNISSGKVNNIQIGGRNIATHTNQGTTGWVWGLQTGGKTISEVTENGIKCCKMVRDNVASTGWSYIGYSRIGRDKYLPNKQYTISFEVKSSVATKFTCCLMEGSATNGLTTNAPTAQVPKVNTWTKLSFTLTTKDTLPTSTTQCVYLNGMSSDPGVTYIFRNLMIEEGTKASSWTPAPEDIDAEISAVNNKAQDSINKLTELASDSKLTASEKLVVKREWDVIVGEKTKITSEANKFGVSKTDYESKYNTLNSYITPLLSNLTTTSDINGSTFRSNFTNYYNSRQDLLNAITTKVKTLADNAQSTANTANNTANTVNTTVNNNKNNWSNAYNRVAEWAQGAVTGSVDIDGGKIAANTIIAEKIAVGDFNNYATVSELNPATMLPSSHFGGTKIVSSNSTTTEIAKTNSSNDYLMLSGYIPTPFVVNDELLISFRAYNCLSEDKAVTFAVWYYDANKKYLKDNSVAITLTGKTWKQYEVSLKLTSIDTNVRYVAIGFRDSNGTDLRIRNPRVVRKSMGKMIVDGTIEARHIKSDVLSASTIVSTINNGTTTISGGKITSGTITTDHIHTNGLNANVIKAGTLSADRIASNSISTNKLAIADFTNYCELNPDYLMGKFTQEADSSQRNNPWLVMSTLSRDTVISRTYRVSGGESYRITAEISTTVRGATSNGGSTIDYLNCNVCCFGQKRDGSNYYNTPVGKKNSSGTISVTTTIPSDASTMFVAIQLAGYSPFSGVCKVRNIRVTRMNGGDLIVDGAVTATKMNVKGLTVSNGSVNTLAISSSGNVDINANSMKVNVSGTFKDVGAIVTKAENSETYISQLKTGTRCHNLGAKINFSEFSTYNEGEIYLHGYNANNVATDTNGSISFSGTTVTINKGMINPNAYSIPNGVNVYIYGVVDYTGTWGTWYDTSTKKWKAVRFIGGTEETDIDIHQTSTVRIAIGQFCMTSAEVFKYAYLYQEPQLLSTVANQSDIVTRLTSAESKITADAIISTVSTTISNAKKDAIDSANKNTSDKLKDYVTTTSLTQTSNNITAKFSSSGGYNLLKNSKGKNRTTYWLNNGGGISVASDNTFETCFKTSAPSGIKYSEAIKLKNNTEYVYEGYIYSRTAIGGSSASPLHYWCNTTPNTTEHPQLTVLDYRQQVSSVNKWTKCYVHFRTASSGDVYFTPFIYVGGSATFDIWATELSLSESAVESKWTPHPSEIYEGSTVIDASGITVNNGAIRIKNKAGETALQGDANGNLVLNGGHMSVESWRGGMKDCVFFQGGGINLETQWQDTPDRWTQSMCTINLAQAGKAMNAMELRGDSFHFKGIVNSSPYITIDGGLIANADINTTGIVKTNGIHSNATSNNRIDLKSHNNDMWFRSTSEYFTFQCGTGGDNWTQSFGIRGVNSPAEGQNQNWIDIGQMKSNASNGSYRGVSIRKYVNGGATAGDLIAGRYYMFGSENAYLTNHSNTGVKIQSPHGYCAIGPQNGSYCHYVTDRPTHWFDRNVAVQGEIRCGSGYNQLVPYGLMSNEYDNGTGEVCEGRIHIGGNKYIYYGWCSVHATAGTSAERTYTVPDLKRIRGITIQCYTKGGTGNFGELALKQTYSNGFTFRLYNATNTGTHYITYMIIGE